MPLTPLPADVVLAHLQLAQSRRRTTRLPPTPTPALPAPRPASPPTPTTAPALADTPTATPPPTKATPPLPVAGSPRRSPGSSPNHGHGPSVTAGVVAAATPTWAQGGALLPKLDLPFPSFPSPFFEPVAEVHPWRGAAAENADAEEGQAEEAAQTSVAAPAPAPAAGIGAAAEMAAVMAWASSEPTAQFGTAPFPPQAQVSQPFIPLSSFTTTKPKRRPKQPISLVGKAPGPMPAAADGCAGCVVRGFEEELMWSFPGNAVWAAA